MIDFRMILDFTVFIDRIQRKKTLPYLTLDDNLRKRLCTSSNFGPVTPSEQIP